MSFSAPRDVLQISLGSSANAVTAHSLNLQGLAATTTTTTTHGVEEATCDAPTTHYLHQNHWVPRVLLVDELTRFFVSPQVSQQAAAFFAQQQQQQQKQQGMSALNMASPFAIQALDPSLLLQHEQPQEWSQRYSQTSAHLAYSSHSRYYQEATGSNQYRVSTENPRHVNWEEELDGEEDDDDVDGGEDEDPREKQARLARERNVWQNQTLRPLQQKLTTLVDEAPFVSKQQQQEQEQVTPNSAGKDLHWMEYWMPPYADRSKVAIEYSQQSHLTPNWDSYYTHSRARKEWEEDVLMEEVRHLLEECDACQGIMITTEGCGIYAGLTTRLLQEMQEEVRSAGRIVFHIDNPKLPTKNDSPQSNDGDDGGWQAAHVARLRHHLSSGLALYEFTRQAHMVVPLQLPYEQSTSLFEASARLAMALEACTLPIRLKNSARRDPRYDIGLLNAPFFGQGGGDSQWGTTAQRVSVSEFFSCLQPSPQYKLVELDTTLGRQQHERQSQKQPMDLTNEHLWQALQMGTSIERDARMRESGRDGPRFRPQDVAPGEWLQDRKLGGLLSCLSPHPNVKATMMDRSLHHNFALSTAIRPVLCDDLSKYLTALVQGMGIRYRPERSMSTVLNQTIGQLTLPGGYGAGAYWKSLTTLEEPIVAVLGNTTRSYWHLDQRAKDMKLVLGSRYRGYYQRDLMNGVLPEAEDCQEALEGCWDLRDVYSPPDGSGLLEEEVDIDI